MIYRMSQTATICFTVVAATEDEAIEKAKAVVDEFPEGIDLSKLQLAFLRDQAGINDIEARVYIDGDHEAIETQSSWEEPTAASEPLPEYQTYGIDAQGLITHAGPRRLAAVNIDTARRLQAEWEAWREQYLAANPGDYPLRSGTKPTVKMCIEPVGHPELAQWFDL